MLKVCASNRKGVSNCFAAVDFTSSPTEPSQGGVWNYTINIDSTLGGRVDVSKRNNDEQVYMFPLQHEIDVVIKNPSNPPEPQEALQLIYTGRTNEDRLRSIKENYFSLIINNFGMLFFFAMVEVAYHLPGLVASERELGMAQLIDAMMPVGAARWKSQFARLMSTWLGIACVYAPGWLAVGVVMGVVVFTQSSTALSVFYHLLAGLALTSFSMVGAVF